MKTCKIPFWQKLIVQFAIILFLPGIVLSNILISTQKVTYPILNSPLSMTKITYKYKVYEGNHDYIVYRYNYFLHFQAYAADSQKQRIEYVGFRAKFQSSMKYVQILQNGTAAELTDPKQRLFVPSRLILQPTDSPTWTYQLFTQPVDSNFCIESEDIFNVGNHPEEITFVAAYGYLTKENLDLIAANKAARAKAAQQGITYKSIDEDSLKLALAQENLFRDKKYWEILKLKCNCPVDKH